MSDHFHPWLDVQGQSPFVWSVLGAIARETDELELVTAVTCPTIRMHPAVVAQAAATTASLMPGRFSLGLGSGENLNEHIVGTRWPAPRERLDMLEHGREQDGGSHPRTSPNLPDPHRIPTSRTTAPRTCVGPRRPRLPAASRPNGHVLVGPRL